jgi:hypothetical protein
VRLCDDDVRVYVYSCVCVHMHVVILSLGEVPEHAYIRIHTDTLQEATIYQLV